MIIALALLPFLPILLRGDVPVFRDHADYFVPLRFFTTAQLRVGTMPWWNPFNGGGEPWIGNPQTAVFYPPALLFLVLPFAGAYVTFLALHLALLGTFTARLFGRFASPSAATVGAVACMLAGPTLSLVDVQNNLLTLCWIPFAIDVATRPAPRLRRIALLALAFTLMFLGGEPFLTLIGVCASLVAALAHARFTTNDDPMIVQRGSVARATMDFVVAGALSLATSAPQLIPFVAALRGSDRAAGLPASVALQSSVALRDWLALLAPGWSLGAYGRLGSLSQQFIPSLFVSATIVACAVVAIASWRTLERTSRAIVAALLTMIAVVIVFALGSHVRAVGEAIIALHLNVSRYPARVIPLATLALAALASIGWDALSAAGSRARIIALSAVSAMGAAAMHVLLDTPAQRVMTLVDVGVALVLVMTLPRIHRTRIAGVLTVAIIAAELLVSGLAFFVSAPLSQLRTSYAAHIDRRYNVARIIESRYGRTPFDTSGKRRWMSGYLNLLSGVHDISTPAPIVSSRYLAAHDVALAASNRSVTDALSVGTVITSRNMNDPTLVKIGGSGEVNLYRNRRALPMVTVWDGASPCGSSESSMQRWLYSDARHFLCVNGTSGSQSEARVSSGRTPRFIGSNIVRTKVACGIRSLVVFNQNDAAGWSVTVDGRPAPKLLVNGLFRGVLMNPGSHDIEWRYDPPLFRVGLLLGFFGAAILAVLLALSR